jgi:ATP-dependent Clp protease ATP-binding subunit ClpC
MSDLLVTIIVGGAAGFASSLMARRRTAPAALAPSAPMPVPAPLPPAATPPHAPAPTQPGEPETLARLLPSLNKALSPLAEDVGHPGELLDMPEFQAVLAAFRRPDATLEFLGQQAQGANWPFAAAAFVVLADHPERQSLCTPLLRQFGQLRPYVLLFALRYLTSLKERPPVGAALLDAPQWWQNNQVIPGFYEEYFQRSADLGDQPGFGDLLQRRPGLDPTHVDGLLRKIQHPFAGRLLATLQGWGATRIDRAFLTSIGTLSDPADKDPLLVLPPAWEAPLATAATVIRQKRPRSIVVTGDPRIGKSAFIALLGAALESAGWTVFSASGAELMADQMYIGQLEGRIRKLVEALHTRRKIVWHVGDIAQLARSGTHQGQTASILDQIQPAMAAGELIVIGECGPTAAARLFQSRPSLRSLVETLPLEAMDEAETRALATQVAASIHRATGLDVADQAVSATMELARNYLGADQLPGIVLELLKRAAAHSIAAKERALTGASVLATLSQLSGLPLLILDTHARVELAAIREFFERRVIGQEEAVRAVVDRIAMLKAGLTDPGRPIGVFLFAGPTGTGKTELAKTLAEFLFGSADRMARLDMSEFQTADATSKILGQRGESASDSLIERIRKQPFSVVLLDEFEKAHANTWDLFLQIFDDGRLTDANGHEADFRHCFIILTSNLGAAMRRGPGLGFRPEPQNDVEGQVMQTLAQTFRPEFINRLDKIIVFQPLSRELMRIVLRKELDRVLERRGLKERAWAVEWEASAIELLLDRGFSREMGARPLKRAIDQMLLAPLAATLVEHRFPQGDQFLFVRANGPALEVEFVDPDGRPNEIAEPSGVADADTGQSLPAIVLRQTGSAAERATLAACWREISETLTSESWTSGYVRLHSAMAEPGFWTDEARFSTLSAIEMADRVREASRTAERLFQRYTASGDHTERSSRELAARVALQLFNIRQGLDDIARRAPIDALLLVEPSMEAGADALAATAWCRRLADMYRNWATRRRIQFAEIKDGAALPILHFTGFGAFRTLQGEAGLHVFDEHIATATRRLVARVSVTSGPDHDLPKSGRYAAAMKLLSALPNTTTVVRRYREDPAPMVRDAIRGWRTGKLDAVLAGDFDLIGAAQGAADVDRAAP